MNNAIASVRANPKIEYEKSCFVKDGFRATAVIKEPKTIPIPAPHPARAIVAAPAPITFAASYIKTTKIPFLLDNSKNTYAK